MTDLLPSLLRSPRTLLGAVGADGRLLLRSDRTGTMQVYLTRDGRSLRPLTALGGPVGRVAWAGDRVLLEVDRDGDERWQLRSLDPDAVPDGGVTDDELLVRLTDEPSAGHHLAGVSPDGRLLAYTSNRRNGVDFDLYVRNLASGEERTVLAEGGWCMPASGWSPDGRWLSVLRPGPRPLDTDLLLVEVATGAVTVVLAHPDEAAQVGPPAWTGPDRAWVVADVGRDRAALVPVDPHSGKPAGPALDVGGVAEEVSAAPDGTTLAVVRNLDAAHQIVLVDPATGGLTRTVELPEPGAVTNWAWPGPQWSPAGQLLFSLTTPRRPGDVWSVDPGLGSVRAITVTPPTVPADELVEPSLHQVRSFDGELVPVALYRRADTGPRRAPTVVVVHGGPESQAMRDWQPVVQGLVAAGFAVVVPNVRGSTGYGRRWASLDDTVRRLDSVADLAAIHDWMPSAGLDPDRAALWGTSYGGYMVLAGVAFQPERWAAGVDIVGISDLVTFLEHTSEYRRAHREREYGSLATDREFLASASPMRRVDAIRAALFVIHGRNDPRVPLTEAEQLVAALRDREVPCELVVYDDEGHGLARVANRLDAYPRAVAFLARALGAGVPAGAG